MNETQTIVRVLGLISEVQATHTEMLQALMEAAAEKPGENPLPDLLRDLIKGVNRGNDMLMVLLSRLPAAPPG